MRKITCRLLPFAFAALTAQIALAGDTPRLSLEQLRAQYGDAAGHVAKVGGIDVYYKDEGTGPAILMVHGSASTLKTYDDVVPHLSNRFRIIRYDIPPQGLSGALPDEAAARLKPADIAAGLLDGLHVRSATCVGVSSGGTLCIYLAAQRSDLVERLILANTPSDPVDTSHMQQPADFLAAQQRAKDEHFQSHEFWRLFLNYFAGSPERMNPQIVQHFYDFNRRVPEKNALSLVAQVADHQRALDAMARVSAPTLLVWGARDPLLTPPAADTLRKYLIHAEVSELFLPDVGHFPPLEVPERFARIVAADIDAVAPEPLHAGATSVAP